MRIFAVLLLLAVLSGCSSDPSPVEPPMALKPFESSIRLQQKWVTDIGEGVSHQHLRFQPIWDNDTYYTVDYNGNLYAADVNSGDILWGKNYQVNISAGLSEADEGLIFATEDGVLFMVSKNKGAVIWHVQLTSEILSEVLVVSNAVIARTVDGNVTRLDSKTGKILWVYAGNAPALSLRGTSRPVLYKNLILVGNDLGKVVALELDSGKKVWEKIIASPRGRTEIERIVDIDANMIVVNDLLFVVTYQGKLACLHTETGRVIWTRDFSSYSGMTLTAGKLYLTDSTGYVWALEPRTGATIWKQDKLLRRSLARPVAHQDYIVVGDFNGFLHWLDKDDGHLVARTRLADEAYQEVDAEEDLEFNRKNNFLTAPMVRGDKLIATTRFGYTSLYTIIK